MPRIEITESDYIGEVTSDAPLSEWPGEDGQSNWLKPGSPYARYGSGIIAKHPFENGWELFEVDKLPQGIWALGVLPDERMIAYVKEIAGRDIMQTVLRYEYDGEKLSVNPNGYFQPAFRGYGLGDDYNIYIQDGKPGRWLEPGTIIDPSNLRDAWQDNEIFRFVYYSMPDKRTQYFLAVSEKRIVILDEWITSPNEEFPLSPEDVTSEAMLEEFKSLFAELKGESLVNILEPLK